MIPFTYDELQEAPRVGARWTAIELNQGNWSAFAAPGNVCNTPYAANPDDTLAVNSVTIHTLVGEAASKLWGRRPESAADLASQPTLSRLENAVDWHAYGRLAHALLAVYLRAREQDGVPRGPEGVMPWHAPAGAWHGYSGASNNRHA